MLRLAAERSRGVHPYLVTPEHTAIARDALGAGPLVMPEQTVMLAADADDARTIGVTWSRHYLALPNYANSLQRRGFTPDDLDTDHVCVQGLQADQRGFPRAQWRRLAAALV